MKNFLSENAIAELYKYIVFVIASCAALIVTMLVVAIEMGLHELVIEMCTMVFVLIPAAMYLISTIIDFFFNRKEKFF